MKIILNNNEEVFQGDTMTVSEMLTARSFTFRLRVIKVNGRLISREEYDTFIIREGDNVQMHYLMSGG